jgi:hypothetical protein
VDLTSVTFETRQASWVACSGDTFLKIPRRSALHDDPFLNADIEAATKEFSLATWLSEIEPRVLRPSALRLQQGCLIFPRLRGRDLMEELSDARANRHVQSGINEAIEICARIHRGATEHGEIQAYDYYGDLDHPLESQALDPWPRTLVVRGMEVRNFRRDHRDGKLRFFDLHEVFWGMPEEDVSRFVLSLLMLNWGRRTAPKPWANFDFESILAAYEQTSEISLDRKRMNYCMQLNLRMRRRNAANALTSAFMPKRLAGLAYVYLYFSGLNSWMRQNGF